MELETLEVKIQAQARQANGQIDALITRLGKLSSSLQSIDSSGINRLSTGVNRLSNSMSAMRSVDSRSFSTLARNIKTLSSIDTGKINAAAGAMRQISKSVSSFSGMSKSVQGLSELAGGIKQLGYTSSTKAIENIPKLAVAMRQLMAELSKAPMVSQNLINMTNALAKLARTGGAAGTAAKSITSSFSGFTSGAFSATKKSFSLASAIGKLYASYFLLFRGFGKIRDAIDISSSLTEVENVVRTTFGKYESLVNDFAADSIQKFGMSELSVKQFASRFQAMGVAMGFPQGKMADMSVQLTKLTADMASFYDVAQSDVAEDLESIFTGQTRPLRTYGLDLTQATLKEWALTQGIEANFKTMTQAEKAMLRYQYVMANTAAAQGDFARTADTWHNQVTILKQSFQQLAGIVGGALINAFKPLVKTLNAVLQKVIQFATMVTDALGSIFGWKYEASDVGITDDLADSYGNVADAANNAANGTKKAAKEAKKSTRAFDELKVISSNKDKGSSGSGSGSSGGGGGASGSSGKLVAADTIFKDYKSSIKNLEDLGKSIRNALVNAVGGIDWDSIYAKAKNFGSGFATFLNGLFSNNKKGENVFTATADVIAGALNTAIFASKGFTDKFDFEQFGRNLASGFNRFFKKFKWEKCAEAINGWVDGFWKFVRGFFDDLSWKDIFDGLKTFISSLTPETITTIIGAFILKRMGSNLFSVLKEALTGGLSTKLGTAISTEVGKTTLGTGIAGTLATGFMITASVYVTTKFVKDFKEWKANIDKYGWNEGRKKTAEDNKANPYKNGRAFDWEEYKKSAQKRANKNKANPYKRQTSKAEEKKYNFQQLKVEASVTSIKDAVPKNKKSLSNFTADLAKNKDSILSKDKTLKNYNANLSKNTDKIKLSDKSLNNFNANLSKKTDKISSKDKILKDFDAILSSNKDKISSGDKSLKNYTANLSKNKDGIKTSDKSLKNYTAKLSYNKDNIKSSDKKLGGFTALITSFVNNIKEKFLDFKAKITGTSGGAGKSIGKANGGVFYGGSWHSIKKYAAGGAPNFGQMFIAREAGPELVGNLGGHTAVMNNDQIVSSVANGVAQATERVLRSYIRSNGNGGQPIQIVLDGKVIFDSTRKSAQEFFNKTGTAPYPV